MTISLDGIEEKLKRARENIKNLQAEIGRFFEASDYPEIPQDDTDIILKAIAYHKKLAIPPRFSVLAGEIVHHLRSCLDHIVWQFSSPEYRTKHFRIIEFPVRKSRPVDEKSIASHEGKIKGITDTRVRDLINKLQPYNVPDPLDDPLFIIHSMDIIDKHRELVICFSAGGMDFPFAMREVVESYQRVHPELTSAEVAFQFKGHGKLVPQIAFKDFGRRTIQPVIPRLMELFNYVVGVVKAFDGYNN
jgi:hypothetical protein